MAATSWLVWLAIVLPGLWPVWPLFVAQDPSALADPLKLILHHWGLMACLLLVAVLTFTPLRVLFRGNALVLALNRHRRLVGVSSAVYALLHFAVHVLYEGGADPQFIPDIVRAVVEKPFQLTGLIALSVLLVLALTSPHAVLRRMGAKRWKALHRLAYVAVALVAYHQVAAHKVFPMQVLWIFGPLGGLEVARVWVLKKGAIRT